MTQFLGEPKPRIFTKYDYSPGDVFYGRGEIINQLPDLLYPIIPRAEERTVFMSTYVQGFSAEQWEGPRYKLDPKLKGAYELHKFSEKYEDKYDPAQYYHQFSKGLFKKRSKLGILWAIQKGYKIHFVTDAYFDINKCFNKQSQTITSSELRFIYRNWRYLWELNQILFWKAEHGQLVNTVPPWMYADDLKYEPTNPRRYADFFAQLATEKEKKGTARDTKIADSKTIERAEEVQEQPSSFLHSFFKYIAPIYGSTNEACAQEIMEKTKGVRESRF